MKENKLNYNKKYEHPIIVLQVKFFIISIYLIIYIGIIFFEVLGVHDGTSYALSF